MQRSTFAVSRRTLRTLKAIPILLLTFILALVLVVVVNTAVPVLADTAGPSNAGTGADDPAVGTIAWTNPTNIQVAGTPYAIATAVPSQGGKTHYLKGTNYGFAIPSGATIDGITVTIRRQSSGALSPFIRDSEVKLVKGGTVQTTNKAVTGTDWALAPAWGTATYGGAADLWGTTWTAADINAANFGVVLAAANPNPTAGRPRDATVDYMQITITYTPAVTIPTTLTVSTASGTYGGTASLTATLTVTAGGAPVVGRTISFTLNAVAAGTAVTDGSGVANIPAASLSGINAGSYPAGVGASFAGDATYDPSSGTNSLTVNTKELTVSGITADNKTYDAGTTATLNTGSAAWFSSVVLVLSPNPSV